MQINELVKKLSKYGFTVTGKRPVNSICSINLTAMLEDAKDYGDDVITLEPSVYWEELDQAKVSDDYRYDFEGTVNGQILSFNGLSKDKMIQYATKVVDEIEGNKKHVD